MKFHKSSIYAFDDLNNLIVLSIFFKYCIDCLQFYLSFIRHFTLIYKRSLYPSVCYFIAFVPIAVLCNGVEAADTGWILNNCYCYHGSLG